MPTITVTQTHIDQAARLQRIDNQTELCPVRLALRDACGFDILVGSDTFEAIDGFAEVEIPLDVQRLIHEFDFWALHQASSNTTDYDNIKPIAFTLTGSDIARLSGRKP